MVDKNNNPTKKELRNELQEIGDLFRLPGEVKKVTLLKNGSTADTYRVDYDTKKKYLFQKVKVNKDEFVLTMNNVEQITSFLRKNGHNLIHLHHTNSEENYIEYNGEFWRVKRFFDQYSHVDTNDFDVLRKLGVSIASFQYLTKDIDLSKIHNVYPNIHNLPLIIGNSEDEYVISKKETALKVEKAYQEGNIPTRLVHNDARIKTVTFNKDTRFYINVDLAKPGIGLYDFASVALFFCSTTQFGEASEAKLDLEKFSSYLSGYISVMGDFLTDTEKELITASLFSIAVENIVINENRETQKAWCLSIAKDIEENADKIKELVKEVIETTKSSGITFNESSIERDAPISSNQTYKAGEYMPITIPHLVKPRGGKAYSFFKRAFDIFCSLMAIIVFSPFLLIIGLLVVCTSRGPMIYVSKRVGQNGKIFNFYKFRSMYKDADKRLDELLDQNEVEGGVTFKMKNDPRITPFGRFIRKTSIDELPQLFNILKGDMSIIGPRVGLPREVELYPEEALDRLTVPQGLSGEWQANGRSDTSFENMIKMDLEYVTKKRGFWHDIGLIFKTIWVVITGKGAE